MDAFVSSLLMEIKLQQNYLNTPIETLYFGGGTPSLLSEQQLDLIINAIHNNFSVAPNVEFTLEANPDDISLAQTKRWKSIGINRLSIGIQSFQPSALSWMNRAHSTQQSHEAIQHAITAGITNISTDLIYGTPHLSDQDLLSDIAILNDYNINHISCYALTVEEKTALHSLIEKNKIENVDPEKQARHFEMVVNALESFGFEHYEISNFAKSGFKSKHNSNYWKGIPYLGLGPSAHSYNRNSRQWNIANNSLYINSIEAGKVPFEIEALETATQYNEYMMISLRLLEGVNVNEIKTRFGDVYLEHTYTQLAPLLAAGKIQKKDGGFAISKHARFLADGIASEFFIVD